MEKIVKTGRTAVFTLDGTECRLTFSQKYRGFDIENRSDGDILVSFRSGSVEGDDETMTIPAGGSFNFMQMYESDTVYLTGTGKVAVAAKNDSNPNFKSSQGGGDSGTASGSVVGLQIEKYVDEHVSTCVSVSNLPYSFFYSSAVVFNNEIHMLGGSNGATNHYKYNGSSWKEVSTLPYSFQSGAAVVFNNEIHILGGSDGATNHYKYNGSSWKEVSTLPYSFQSGAAVVFNNEIHILGGFSGGQTNHYKYNGTSWESVSTLPYEFYDGSAVVYNNKIHILGSDKSSYYTSHYQFNGTSWESVSTLPYEFYDGSAVVFNNEIHILGSNSSQSTKHYKYSGASWYDVSTLSPGLGNPNAAVIFNSEIYYLAVNKLNIVKNDNHHIATMLPKGTHIMLSDNEDINYVKNAEKVSSNIAKVTETGYVEVLASMPEIYAAKGYLTFY